MLLVGGGNGETNESGNYRSRPTGRFAGRAQFYTDGREDSFCERLDRCWCAADRIFVFCVAESDSTTVRRGRGLQGIERTKPCTLAALVPNAHGAIRAVEAKVDEMIVFMSASESHNQKNVNRSIDESLDGFERVAQIAGDAGIPVHGAIATGFGCPFEGDVSLDTIVKIAKRYHEYGFTGVGLGDTTGMATPPIVTKFVRTLQDAVPEMDIALHFHNTRGIGLVNVVAGLDEGIDKYDASFAGIGGCPFAPKATGNICTEDLVYMLDEMGIRQGSISAR